MRRIAILGSTGSIGTQALDVVRNHRDEYEAVALAAARNGELLGAQAHEFGVPLDRARLCADTPEVLTELASLPEVDVVLNAVVGFAGLLLVFPDGVGMIIGLVLCAVSYDVAGYLVGSRLGHRPLMPDVSPNKTLEGLAGGMAASVVMGILIAGVGLHPWNNLSNGLLLGIVVAIFAPLGDLVESMLKRDLGLKDFGTILPGHGGVLDRFDAMLFCLPAVYYLVVARGLV